MAARSTTEGRSPTYASRKAWRWGGAGAAEGHAEDAAELVRDERVRLPLDPRRHGTIRRAAVRRVVLEAARTGRVVRRGDNDPVGEPRSAPAVVGEDGVRHDRGRDIATAGIDHHVDAVRRQHLERAREGWLGERVTVDAEEEGTVGALLFPVAADRLRDGEDVRLVERRVEGRAAMTRRAKGDPLGRHARVGSLGEIGGHELRQVDEGRGVGGLSGAGVDGHARLLRGVAVLRKRPAACLVARRPPR
jgi:hypothetical protein